MSYKNLKSNGDGNKVSYYYLRDSNGHPRITVCLIYNEKEPQVHPIVRGISICSYKDQILKEDEGKKRAFKRARKAMIRMKSDDVVCRAEAISIVDDVIVAEIMRENGRIPSGMSLDVYKVKSNYIYFEELTEFEKKLVTFVPVKKEMK